MTTRDFIIKWTAYGLALLPVWFAEVFLLSSFPLFGVKPMLLPLAVTAVAVLEGSVAGAGFGLGVGLLWSATLSGSLPGILALSLAGALTGAAAQYGLKQSFAGCLVCSAAVLGAIDLLRVLRRLAGGTAPLGPMLAVALPEILVSLLFAAPIYLLFRKVWSKVGGTKLM